MKPIAMALLCAASASAADYGDILQSIRITGAYSKTITNVVAGDNHSGCSTWDLMHPQSINGMVIVPSIFHPDHIGCSRFIPPTEKWEITTVENVSVLIFNWLGKPRSIEDREVVSCTTNRWTLESEWKPSTNAPAQSQTVTLTNITAGANIIIGTNDLVIRSIPLAATNRLTLP